MDGKLAVQVGGSVVPETLELKIWLQTRTKQITLIRSLVMKMLYSLKRAKSFQFCSKVNQWIHALASQWDGRTSSHGSCYSCECQCNPGSSFTRFAFRGKACSASMKLLRNEAESVLKLAGTLGIHSEGGDDKKRMLPQELGTYLSRNIESYWLRDYVDSWS